MNQYRVRRYESCPGMVVGLSEEISRMKEVRSSIDFLEELRKLIPEIPLFTTSLSIHISKEHATIVKCEFCMRGNGSPELLSKTFRLVEVEESVPQTSEPAMQSSDAVAVAIEPESGVPSKENVLEYLRELFEDDCDCAAQQTSDIASYFDVDHLKLYNHEACTGPLYELLQEGLVMRMESGRRNPEWTPEPGEEWEWVAIGAKIVWDK